jgi:ribosomal protein S18 acetylase RimI-like enzyme
MNLHRRLAGSLLWVAEEAGEIVGTIGAVDYGGVAYIGLMAVDPARQRQGIARLLVERLLQSLDARGCPIALLDATDKGAPLYAQFGFVDDSQARVFELDTLVAAGESPTGLEVTTLADLGEIVAFDTAAFGATRQSLLGTLWSEYRERLLVARDAGGQLAGYLFARDPTLGPWAAASVAGAEALLSEALRLPFSQTPHVLVPRSNDAVAGLLERYGFVQRRTLRHMRRGGTGSPGMPERLFGQSSFAHG